MNRPVKRAIDRLSALGGRISALNSDANFEENELKIASEDVRVVSDSDLGCLWILVRDADTVLGLLRLYILAAHRSLPRAGAAHPAAYAELRRALSHEVGKLDIPARTGNDADVRRGLALLSAIVKSKTLNYFSAIAAGAAASDGRHDEPSTALPELIEVLQAVCSPLYDTIKADKERHLAMEDYRALLEAELPASEILEHAARLLLKRLQGGHIAQSIALCNMLHNACKMFASFWAVALCQQLPTGPCLSFLLSCHIVSACADLGCGGGEGGLYGMPQAFRLPTGYAFRQADTLIRFLSAWQAAVMEERSRLAAALGGDSGLPYPNAAIGTVSLAALGGEAPAAAMLSCYPLRPLYRRELSLLQQRHGQDGEEGQQPPAETAASAVRELEAARLRLELSATPPLNTTATFELCMRLAEGLVAAEAPVQLNHRRRPNLAAGNGSGNVQVTALSGLPPGKALRVAMQSLMCAREALAGEKALREPRLPPALAARLGRWWGAAIAAVTAAASQQRPSADFTRPACTLLSSLAKPNGPADPPSADQSAARYAGYLTCLAAYLRAALRPGSGATRASVCMLLHKHVWTQLLAFGEIRKAASVMAAVAEALAEHAAALSEPGATGAVKGLDEAEECLMFVTVFFGREQVERLLPRCSGASGSAPNALGHAPGHEAGPGEDGGARSVASGPERLGAVASVVVARLLPEMARLLQVLMQAGRGSLAAVGRSVALLLGMVPWLAAGLARASGAWGKQAGDARESGGSDDAAAESWRQLLLVELRLPALLGAALRLLTEHTAASGGKAMALQCLVPRLSSGLLHALAVLAAWTPAELARLVAAADRAVAGGRGGRSGALPTTALLRSVLGRGGCRPAPEVLEAVEAACGGAGPQRVPAGLPPDEMASSLHWGCLLLPPSRARELLSASDGAA
ncbi:hypothetical protein GPECTOR_59g681 [Gonium pectorale]|uniref:Uncharacterized protein n=1 Tax=Gonium pectorale TaxID=33097 RepID=A0A150G5D8_GONPE|nr:hypothetical protein GPECTOR_59g681 [Gonium pectorale]|eukprot:KXZ45072.1 hypothetical protein GPECTOR_59g681 [Gonium pectorale]